MKKYKFEYWENRDVKVIGRVEAKTEEEALDKIAEGDADCYFDDKEFYTNSIDSISVQEDV